MKKILLASNNKHKAIEFNKIIKDIIPGEIDLILPGNISEDKFDVEETGKNFFENAYIKAKAFYDKFHLPVISDDSGLEVNALNGEPGLNSARYAGKHGDDAANRRKLLDNLMGIKERNANFIAVLCYYSGDEPIFFEGKVFGNIINNEQGSGGFGYDPLFIPEGYSETFAEMSDKEKNKISHRAMALQRFARYLSEN